jgi:anti-sigma factor ChrR (cupin superfamily)
MYIGVGSGAANRGAVSAALSLSPPLSPSPSFSLSLCLFVSPSLSLSLHYHGSIRHTVILEDPFDDPPGLVVPERSPSPTPEQLAVRTMHCLALAHRKANH